MLDFGLPFFRDDPKAMTQVVRQVKQPCFGFKNPRFRASLLEPADRARGVQVRLRKH